MNSAPLRKKIPGLPDIYEADENGNIWRLPYEYQTTFRGRSLTRPIPEKILGGTKLSKKGYKRVRICGGTYFVHRLIAMTFIPNPENLPQVNHKNGIKTDNRVCNLEWVTNQQNRDHAVASGLHPYGSRISKKLREQDIPHILSLAEFGVPQRKIGEMFGISQQGISHIVRRNTWRHV